MNFRIAAFNIENLDDREDELPSIEQRAALIRPQLERLKADILCLQEVHSQKGVNGRELRALRKLVEDTRYNNYKTVGTKIDDEYMALRNVVTMTHFDITETQQYLHDLIKPPEYKTITSDPPENIAERILWERPTLYTTIQVEDHLLHVINIHLKSKNPTAIAGQQRDLYSWKTASGWAEGSFLSAMKRLGQAAEVRSLVDNIFDENPQAKVIVAGDFNADIYDTEMEAITGRVENTGNEELLGRTLIPCELSIPESARFTLYHQGRKNMLDHILISKALLPFYQGSEIHNEGLSDESIAFASDLKFPGSDHAPVVASFVF